MEYSLVLYTTQKYQITYFYQKYKNTRKPGLFF